MPSPPESPAEPTYLGMVLCDNVIQDPETSKYFLLGTANVTFAESFPIRLGKLCMYVVLTDIREHTKLNVRLVRVDPERNRDIEMMSIQTEVDAPDPLAVAELTLGMRNLIFPQPGVYRFQLWCGSSLLGERKFVVNLVAPRAPRRT